MDIKQKVTYKKDLIKRIMILSHELGFEIGYDETLDRAEKLRIYLHEYEGNVNADLEHALTYLRDILKKKHDDKR